MSMPLLQTKVTPPQASPSDAAAPTPSAGMFPVYDTPLGRLAGMICHDANYTDIARKLAANGTQIIAAPYGEFGGFGKQAWTFVLSLHPNRRNKNGYTRITP